MVRTHLGERGDPGLHARPAERRPGDGRFEEDRRTSLPAAHGVEPVSTHVDQLAGRRHVRSGHGVVASISAAERATFAMRRPRARRLNARPTRAAVYGSPGGFIPYTARTIASLRR